MVEHITIRQAVQSDLAFLTQCVVSQEYCQYIGSLSATDIESIKKENKKLYNDIYILETGGRNIGFAEFYGYDPINRNVSPNVFLVPNQRCTRVAGRALFAVLKFAFEYYHVHKVILVVYGRNQTMRHILTKRGIVEEALLRQRIKIGNEYEDAFMYSILEPEFMAMYQKQKRDQ